MRSAFILFLCAGAFAATPNQPIPTAPVQFQQTANQWSARGLGYAFRFEKTGTAMRLGDRTLRMQFENSNPFAPFVGLEHSAHPTNSFHGQTYQRIENYARLRRTGVYPGIDLLYYSRNGELEYDFEIAPGADPSPIALRFEGADSARLNDRGDLVLSLAGKELTERAPSIYQRRKSGEMVTVAGSYRIGADGAVRFRLGDYDRSAALVIDPSVVYVSFLGGSFADVGISIGHDAQGFIYEGGYTYSSDFPVGGLGFNVVAGGEEDCFIIKINPAATDPSEVIVYSTYYGGASNDGLTAMKVSPAGLVYFTGNTDSTNFPVSASAFSSVLSSLTTGTHAFVAELDTTQDSSNSQVYSSYFGGSTNSAGTASTDSGQGIFAAPNGRIYITGFTTSVDFPLTGASQAALGGSYDAFIAEFDPAQSGTSSLIFSTPVGGAAQDWGNDIAVNSSGVIYITGYTYSSDFPFTAATAYANYHGAGDAFLTLINPGSGTVVYSTFFGGSAGLDEANKILIDPAGKTVAIAGFTLAPNMPTTQNAYQPVMPGATNVDPETGELLASNGFLAIFDMTTATAPGKGLNYSTFFGGFGGEVIYGLRNDAQGNYYICGYTLSQNLPVTSNAFNTTSAGGGQDGFVTILNPAAVAPASQLIYSSYVTSPGTQTVYDVDIDAKGVIWMTGVATAGIFPPGFEEFPDSPSSAPGYPISELGKQLSFIWGFTLPPTVSNTRVTQGTERRLSK
jgi:hypothetical protein